MVLKLVIDKESDVQLKVKSLVKFYHKDLVVRIINEDGAIVFTGKVEKIPDKFLTKNVVDVNPTINRSNKIVVEFGLGKGDMYVKWNYEKGKRK